MSEKIEQLVQDAINCFNQRDWVKAQKAFEDVLALEPEHQEARAFLGSILVNLGNNEEALAKFETVHLTGPSREYFYGEWGVVLNDWGRALFETGRNAEAAHKFAEALEHDPSSSSKYYYNWGLSLERQDLLEPALEKYKQATELDPVYAVAYKNLGRLFIKLGRQSEFKELEQKLQPVPEFKDVFFDWGWTFEKQEQLANRYEEAARQYEKAVQADNSYLDAWNNWGRMLLELGKISDAIAKFKKTLKLNPQYKYGHYNWGKALERQEDNSRRFEEAARKFRAAVKADPTYTDAWNEWGRMLLNLKKYEDAIEKFKSAIQVDPQYRYAHFNSGWALEKMERYEEAEKQYRRLLEIDPEYTTAIKRIGKILITQDRQKEFDELVSGLGVEARFKNAYYELGNLLLDLERYQEAFKQFKCVESLDAGNVDARIGCCLALVNQGQYQKAIEILHKCIKTDPSNVFALYLLGWIYANGSPKDYGRSLKHFDQALEIKADDLFTQTAYGYVYIELSRFEDARRIFDNILQVNKDIPDGYHSLAYLHEKLGNYKESQLYWQEALARYEKIDKGDRRPIDWSFIAQIYLYVFHRYEKALEVLREGLKKYPESSELLKAAVDINLELKEKYRYESPRDFETVGALHWDAHNAFRKVKSVLQERLEKFEGASMYLDLGNLCNSMNELEDARKYLEKAIESDPDLSGAYNALGVIMSKQEKYKEAIQYFQSALNKNAYDFGYASNLAEAYRKAGLYDQAEKEYQKILNIAPSHMDSLIGLGETYAALGDAAKEGSHAADAEMMYTQAIQYYSKAIKYEEETRDNKHGGFTEASKRLKEKELNAVYYSRGYARVSLYDAQARKSDLLLLQAQNDFRKVNKFPADENYHKARRAIRKLTEKLNPISPQNLEQRTGPAFISLLAFALFAISLFAFVKGRPEISSPGFALTEETVQILEATNIPPEAVDNLEALVGKEFTTQDGLLAAVELAVGPETFTAYEEVLAAQPFEEPAELVWKPIEIGYLAVMAFGSLIFMVAGLYLQQISKLKFGSIEIEKSSVSQISSSGVLGIKK